MARAKPEKTRYPGILKRATTHGTVYDITYSVNGKRYPPIRGQFTNLEEAKRHRDDLIYKAHHGVSRTEKPKTLEAFLRDDWLVAQDADAKTGRLRPSTVYNRRRDVEAKIIPELGEMLLPHIGVREVERFQNGLLNNDLSAHTVLRIVRTLSTALSDAKRLGLIQTNPAVDVRKPPAKREREPVILTAALVETLASAAKTDERNMILLAAWAGLRQGELFGLRWQNVEMEEGAEVIRVVEQVYGGVVVPRPKTPSGRREVILTPHAVEALRSQARDGRYSPDGFVFPSPDGKPWRGSNFNRRRWQTIREDAGLPELKFHDLRHFFVSYIRGLNLAPALTQQLVGHSDERTHDSYTHVIPGTESLIRKAFGAGGEGTTE